VSHPGKLFGKQHGDQRIILDDEHAKRFHQRVDAYQ
jgi:hypothetical protein